MNINWKKYIDIWQKVATQPSGNYASNLPLDVDLLEKLMENHISDEYFNEQISLTLTKFPKHDNTLSQVDGLDILAGIQGFYKKDCVTVYRAIRFPTPRRILKMAKERGISMLNFEHERLLRIYEDPTYIKKREEIKMDPKFSFLPQERIVPGLPIFFSVNDAIHIHRAYRSENDIIGLSVAFIPYDLIKKDKIEIFSNYALVQDCYDSDGDKKLHYFKQLGSTKQFIPFYKALNMEGNMVYETYCKGVPEQLNDCSNLGIEQKHYLLEIYKPKIDIKQKKINNIDLSGNIFEQNPYFLYGFWGDDNIFMRRPSEYLPKTCYEVKLR